MVKEIMGVLDSLIQALKGSDLYSSSNLLYGQRLHLASIKLLFERLDPSLHLINKAKELAATIKQGKETHAIGRIHSLGCYTMFIIRWYNILHFCGWVNKWHTLNCDLFNVFNVKSSLSMCHDHVVCKVKC